MTLASVTSHVQPLIPQGSMVTHLTCCLNAWPSTGKGTDWSGALLDARPQQALRAAVAGPAGGAQAVPEVGLADAHAVAVGRAALAAVRRRLYCMRAFVSGAMRTGTHGRQASAADLTASHDCLWRHAWRPGMWVFRITVIWPSTWASPRRTGDNGGCSELQEAMHSHAVACIRAGSSWWSRTLAGIGFCMRYRPHQSPAVPWHRSAMSLGSNAVDMPLPLPMLLLPRCRFSAAGVPLCWSPLDAPRAASRSSTLLAAVRSVSEMPSEPAHLLSMDTASCAAWPWSGGCDHYIDTRTALGFRFLLHDDAADIARTRTGRGLLASNQVAVCSADLDALSLGAGCATPRPLAGSCVEAVQQGGRNEKQSQQREPSPASRIVTWRPAPRQLHVLTARQVTHARHNAADGSLAASAHTPWFMMQTEWRQSVRLMLRSQCRQRVVAQTRLLCARRVKTGLLAVLPPLPPLPCHAACMDRREEAAQTLHRTATARSRSHANRLQLCRIRRRVHAGQWSAWALWGGRSEGVRRCADEAASKSKAASDCKGAATCCSRSATACSRILTCNVTTLDRKLGF